MSKDEKIVKEASEIIQEGGMPMETDNLQEECFQETIEISKGDRILYKDKKLSFRAEAGILCQGILDIEHCEIIYNDCKDSKGIMLKTGASLTVRDSVIVCKGNKMEMFIKGEKENRISFENCTFIDCSNFLSMENYREITVRDCEMKNCYINFISVGQGKNRAARFEFARNVIRLEELSDFNAKIFTGRRHSLAEFVGGLTLRIIEVRDEVNSKVEISGNTVCEEENYRSAKKDLTYFLIESEAGEIKDCSFRGISGRIQVNRLADSKFEDCGKINSGSMQDGGLIENCVFLRCSNCIDCAYHSIIRNCQFEDCKDEIIFQHGNKGGVVITKNSFRNLSNSGEGPCIYLCREPKRDSKVNVIRKCVFDGVKLENNYLVEAALLSERKPKGAVLSVQNCEFKNCAAKNSPDKISREDLLQASGFPNGSRYQAIEIKDCSGLDEI